MNSAWPKLLTQHGAVFENNTLLGFDKQDADENPEFLSDSICPLVDLSIIEICGEDALTFLNSQFTTDISRLSTADKQYSAWCNPKGRVIALFFVYRDGDRRFFLLLPDQLKESFCRRLQMYVLRADVKIVDRSKDLIATGLRCDKPSRFEQLSQYKHFYIADRDKHRLVIIAGIEETNTLWQKFASQLQCIAPTYWHSFHAMAGMAWVDAETTEHFIPQELNLDCIEAVNFNKGCYPGQEIVARIRYRGQVKKRMALFSARTDSMPAAGTKLYNAAGERAIGSLAGVYPYLNGQYLLLCVIELAELETQSIHLAAKDGPLLSQEGLPYSYD